ncbi:hypothetical protein I4U23_024544 [Adineta vaga]|nr:hypothetical protein I4U23_024544 [Adineta vaga]
MSTTLSRITTDSPQDQTCYSTLSTAEEKRLLSVERSLERKRTCKTLSQKQLTKINNTVRQMTPAMLDEELTKKKLCTRGTDDIQRGRLKNHYKNELLFDSKNPLTLIEQPFEYIAVVDFEATCDENQKNYLHEIIEFPIVLIDVKQQAVIDQFQSYCRPVRNPILTKFCTDLTGIQQRQVDAAPIFVEVLHNVESWLNERNLLSSSNKSRLAFATDGPWDFAKFLRLQCRLSSILYPEWANKWVNIRKRFAQFYSIRIVRMLEYLNLSFDGHRHSGLDDSINIARIAVQLLKDGCILSLNDGVHTGDPEFAAMTNTNTEFACNPDAATTDSDEIVFEN